MAAPPRTTMLLVVALVVCCGSLTTHEAAASATGEPTIALAGDSTPLIWPGGGRMLSAPLVVGGSILGDGSLEMVGDQITPNRALIGGAPPELTLRLFTLVPAADGAYVAVLRFRAPIIVRRSWRGQTVRETMTVVVTSPSGEVRAVQLQPDGTGMAGSFSANQFTPTEPGRVAILGDVVVFDLPASFGITPDWAVQAIVKMQASEPLHQGRPATGYAAGTSIVPVGLLTGAAEPSAAWGVADATSALTVPVSNGDDSPRPVGVRVEGSGGDLVAVVSLDRAPSALPAGGQTTISLDLARAGYATLDHPIHIVWLPAEGSSAPPAQVLLDSTVVGQVPVAVAGNDVRFMLGAATRAASVAAPLTPPLDQGKFHGVIPLGLDEAVNAADGITGPAVNPDQATIDIDGPTVTVTPQSSGIVATGRIEPGGYFTATSPADMFSGWIDVYGNVEIYRTNLGDATDSPPTTAAGSALTSMSGVRRSIAARTVAPPNVSVDDDYLDGVLGSANWVQILDYAKRLAERQREDYEAFKNSKSLAGWYLLRNPSPPPEMPLPLLPDGGDIPDGVFATVDGTDQPPGAQGGTPDWPTTPIVTGSNSDGDSATFVMRADVTTLDQGRPDAVTTPWMGSWLLAATPAAIPPATTSVPTPTLTTQQPSTTPAPSTPPGPTVIGSPTKTLATASPEEDDSSASTIAVAAAGTIVVLTGGGIALARRSRTRRPR